MKLRLIHKLLIALFTSTALVAVLIVLISRFSIGRGFVDFLQQTEHSRLEQIAPELADWYTENGDWSIFAEDPRQFYRLVVSAVPEVRSEGRINVTGQPGGRPERRRQPPEEGTANRPGERPPPGENRPGARGRRGGPGEGRRTRDFGGRLYLLDADGSLVVGTEPPQGQRRRHENKVAILVAGNKVGWLGTLPLPHSSVPEEQAFLHKQFISLLIALGAGLLLAAGLAVMLSRHLSRPVAAIGDGIRSLAAGDYDTSVETTGADEISALGRDVNRLATALKENETARQRWMADIAHELRTPLSILQGELEAMADGVRPLDTEHLASVQAEVKHISALVSDLHQLALTDSGALTYKMGPINFDALVASAVDSFGDKAAAKQLVLSYTAAGREVSIEGDEQRLTQLLRNLLENAVRYTDSGGEIRVSLVAENGEARLEISDSAPGVAADECEKLFERLYRVETSRNRGTGGSGLGLSICKNIVAAHGGTISADRGQLGGVLIRVVMSTV